MAAFQHLVRIVIFSVLFSALPLLAQQPTVPDSSGPCAMPVFNSKVVTEPDLFNDQQEEWLGEIMDQGLRQDFNIVEDPDGYLQKLGERLLAQLPPTTVHYHFLIIDSPELNSFGVAGGRIYIHRRMIAFTQNEGELAALMGHEIGHAATHQVAIQLSQWLRELGVTQIGDRQDVLKKWNFFKDNAGRLKNRHDKNRYQDEQLIADRVGLYAMTRAGYDPAQFVEFADRSLQTKGKTGNFWTDFFGRTTPESHRLREIIHSSAPLPANCIAPRPANDDYFAKWQQDVIASRFAAAHEELPGLISKIKLQKPLRGDIYRAQFSPDGKYLLAQDASSIFILTRDPLANVFRIDALDSHAAQFTPDSQSVVFYDKELRVEKWDLTAQKRTSVHALTVPECYQTSLSPSGEYMACVGFSPEEATFDIKLIEVLTNKIVYSKKKFYAMNYGEAYSFYLFQIFGINPGSYIGLRFSPDSRYFLAGHGNAALGYDLNSHSELRLSSHVRELMGSTFTFVTNDEIAALQNFGPTSKLVRERFPSGDKIDEFKLPLHGSLHSTGQSNYLLLQTKGTTPIVVIDLNAKKADTGFRSTGFGVYGQFFAGEQTNGAIGLFSSTDNKRIAEVALPESPLPSTKASAFSPDGKWLALSGDARGSLWKLEDGDRIFFTFAFEGAYFDQDKLVAKVTLKADDPPRMFELDPANKATKKLFDFDNTDSKFWRQEGKVLISLHPEKENEKNIFYKRGNSVLEVRDPRTNTVLWEKRQGKTWPLYFCNENIVTLVHDDYDGIKAIVKDDPVLSKQFSAIDSKRDAYLIQAFDATTGKTLGSVLVDTGKLSFKVRWAFTVGDTVLVADSHDRTLVYSLKSGEQRGKVLGHVWAASPSGDRILVGLDRGVAEMYDTGSLQLISHFGFPARISDADFTADGAKLMVLTADQTVYQLKTTAETKMTATEPSK